MNHLTPVNNDTSPQDADILDTFLLDKELESLGINQTDVNLTSGASKAIAQKIKELGTIEDDDPEIKAATQDLITWNPQIVDTTKDNKLTFDF